MLIIFLGAAKAKRGGQQTTSLWPDKESSGKLTEVLSYLTETLCKFGLPNLLEQICTVLDICKYVLEQKYLVNDKTIYSGRSLFLNSCVNIRM